MNRKIGFLSLLTIFFLALVSYRVSFSFFNDSGSSTSNTFAAASVFPTPTPLTNHIVISEVQIDGGIGQANNHDFVELYNPTGEPFNLNGHRLVKRTGAASPSDTLFVAWTVDTFVSAHGFYLWASSTDTSFPSSIGADVSSSDTLAGNNSVAIRNGPSNTGTIVDALSWSSVSGSLTEGIRFTPDPGVNQSMERKALSTSTATSMGSGGADEFKGNGFDSDNNSIDFVLRTASQPQNSGSAAESP